MFADFQPKSSVDEKPTKGFRVKYEDIDAKAIDALVTELLA